MIISRRGLLGSSVVVPLALTRCQSSPRSPAASALAQEFTVAASIPNDGRYYYMHDPGIALLPNGTIVVAAPCLQGGTVPGNAYDWSGRVFIARSVDRGRTFQQVAKLDGYSDATPFVHDGKLYMFVQQRKWHDVSIRRSIDEGATWSEPVRLFEGFYWNCHTSMAFERGRLFWALQKGMTETEDYGTAELVVIAGDPKGDLLSPAAWRMSSSIAHPKTPAELVPAGAMSPASWGFADAWLEPNTISVNGRIRVLLRMVIDGYATTGAAVVCDLDDASMTLHFTQIHPMPGAQCKFFMLDDRVSSGSYWMLANLPADAQGQVFDWNAVRASGPFLNGPGNDRRFLMLFYSADALTWFPAGCVARAASLLQSYMYPAAAIDGDDIVLIARTSLHAANQHDADLVTFHRIENFRSLAMNLRP